MNALFAARKSLIDPSLIAVFYSSFTLILSMRNVRVRNGYKILVVRMIILKTKIMTQFLAILIIKF